MAGRESSLVFDRAPHALCGVRGDPEEDTGFGSLSDFRKGFMLSLKDTLFTTSKVTSRGIQREV